MKSFKYLIIGAGMTAHAAVRGIRKLDTDGSIAIIGAESHPPYKRPPLTKQLWTTDMDFESIWYDSEDEGVDLILGTRVTALDPGQHQVTTSTNDRYRYEKLLLATGGSPRRLPIKDDDVLYFRTCDDYRRLREQADELDEFLVLGAGFIGSELAAALTMNDKQVTMVFPEAAIGARVFPMPLAEALNDYFESRGVKLLTGCKPAGVKREDDSFSVKIEDGRTLHAGAVVAGLGIDPNTDLAKTAGLTVDNGIHVDKQLRTTRKDIYAAGDVAGFYNPSLDQRLRVEHEDNAIKMGKAAGRNMAGDDADYDHLPFFYSDLFDAGYEALGRLDSRMDTVGAVTDPEAEGIIFYLEDEQLCGILFWNVFGELDGGRALIAEADKPTEQQLLDWADERLED